MGTQRRSDKMSSDMMLICEEDDSTYEGEGTESAFFVDECSMGNPWHKFGKWFGERYCKSPSMTEQMMGMKEHDWLELTKPDIEAIKMALNEFETHENLDKAELIQYINSRIGKHISTENW